MDKAYTMMYSLDKSGKIAGNVFTDYSTVESIQEFLNLPPALYNLQAKGRNNFNELLPKFIEYLKTHSDELSDEFIEYLENHSNDITLNSIADYLEEVTNVGEDGTFKNSSDRYEFIKFIIDTINECYTSGITEEDKAAGFTGYFNVNPEDVSKSNADRFKSLLSKYAIEGRNSGKNRIVQGIVSQAESLLNLEASQQPMEMAPVTDAIKRIRKAYGYDDDNIEYNEYDIYTRYLIQRANSIGKMDVGISANGIKAAGALQQYYNYIFAGDMTDERLYGFKDPYIDIVIDQVSSNGEPPKNIINQRFCKIANTKVPSIEKFQKLFDRAHINEEGKVDYTTDPDYKFFEELKQKKGNVDTTNLTHHQKRLVDNFKALLTRRNNDIENYSLLEFAYDSLEFEDNVADYISIFISMSTDNAKELALAKIHGTPELLSMPLAMITLGMDIDSVIDVCVNVLDAVHKQMAVNRFENLSSPNVLDVIDILYNAGQITENTARSLRTIYNFAQELRSITRFFKVNQGVTTKYSDLKAFNTSLSNDKLRQAEHIFGKKHIIPENVIATLPSSLRGLSNDDIWKLLRTPVDFYDLFYSENPQGIIDQYEVGRTVVNVMNIVLESPHFKEQLKATSQIIKFIDQNCGKARIADMLLSGSLQGIEEIEDRKLSGDSKEVEQQLDDKEKHKISGLEIDWKKVKTQTDLERLHSRTLRLIDNWVIGEFIKRNSELRFSISELQKTYPSNVLSGFGSNVLLRLDSEFGLNQFIRFINGTFIPTIQEKFANQHNFFLENLVMKQHHRNDKLQYFDLKFDPYALKDNPVLGHNFNTAAKDFEKIADIPSGITTSSGITLTIGEVFYLYSTITSKGLTTGLGTVSHSAGENKQVFSISKDDIYTELDQRSQLLNSKQTYLREREKLENALKSNPNNFSEKDKIRLDYLDKILSQIEYTENYFNQIVGELSAYTKALMSDNNNATIIIGGMAYNLNLNDSFIETFARLAPNSITVSHQESINQYTGEEHLESLEKMILDLSSNSDIKINPNCILTRYKRQTASGKYRGNDVYLNINVTLTSLGDNNKEFQLPTIPIYLGYQPNQEASLLLSQDMINEVINKIRDSVVDTKLYLFSYDTQQETARTLDAYNDGKYKFIEEEVNIFKSENLEKAFNIDIKEGDSQVKKQGLALLKNVRTFLSTQFDIKKTKRGVPTVQKIAGNPVILIPENTSIDQNTLLDLYLDFKGDDHTLNSKLTFLLKELYPNESINHDDLYSFIKKHKDELSNNLPKVLVDYIQSLMERSLQTNHFKSRVRSKLLEFSKCVNHEKLCYYTLRKDDYDKKISVDVGDIIRHDNGALYLYIGNNEYGEKELILVSRGTSMSSVINDNPWKLEENGLPVYLHVNEILEKGNSLTLFKKLITTPGIDLMSEKFPTEKSEKEKYIKQSSKKLRDVQIGDLIEQIDGNNGPYLVVNRVDAFTNITSDKGKKRIIKLVLKDKNNNTLLINYDSDYNHNSDPNPKSITGTYKQGRDTFKIELLQDVKVSRKPNNPFDDSDNNTITDFRKFSRHVQLQMLYQASGYIEIKGEGKLFKQIINDDFIQLIDNTIVPIDSITALSVDLKKDEDLESITNNRFIQISNSKEEAKLETQDDSNGQTVNRDIKIFDSFRPEMLEGTWIYKHNDSDDGISTLYPCKYIASNETTVVGIPKVNLDNYHKVESTNIEDDQLLREGDIIYEENIPDNNISDSKVLVHKILSCIKNDTGKGVQVVQQTVVIPVTAVGKDQGKPLNAELNTQQTTKIEQVTYEYGELRSKNIYSKQQRVSYSRTKMLTPESKAQQFINFLHARTGLKVVTVHTGENSFKARVKNGVIEINRDVVKDDKDLLQESIHEFMHVILGNLRLTDPTTYYEIMDRYSRAITGKGISEIGVDKTSVYYSALEQIEESLVRMSAEKAIGLINNTEDISQKQILDDIFKALSDEVSKFFGQNITGENFNRSVDSVLSRTNVFAAQIGSLDLTALRTRSIRLDLLSKIIKNC